MLKNQEFTTGLAKMIGYAAMAEERLSNFEGLEAALATGHIKSNESMSFFIAWWKECPLKVDVSLYDDTIKNHPPHRVFACNIVKGGDFKSDMNK